MLCFVFSLLFMSKANGKVKRCKHRESGISTRIFFTNQSIGLSPPTHLKTTTLKLMALAMLGFDEKATLHPSLSTQHLFLVSRKTCTERTPELAKEIPQFIEDYKYFVTS